MCQDVETGAKGEAQGYAIKSRERLLALAAEWGVATAGREINDIAIEVADRGLQHSTSRKARFHTRPCAPPRPQ